MIASGTWSRLYCKKVSHSRDDDIDITKPFHDVLCENVV